MQAILVMHKNGSKSLKFLLPNAFRYGNIMSLGYQIDNLPLFYSRKGIRLHGQAVKTSPFHGGNTGSIPVGVIKKYIGA